MKFCLLLFAFLITGATLKADPRSSDVQQVIRLQSELVDAYIHRDFSTLDRILADDYVFTNDDGMVELKPQVVADFSRGGERTITSYKISDQIVRVYGDAAVMTYGYTSRETYNAHEVGGAFRITRVFARFDGHWRMVAGHECRVATVMH